MVENLVVSNIENAMRSLIATVLSVATLLSVSSSAFAQGAQPNPLTPQPTPQLTPQPTPSPTPSTAAPSQPTTPADYMRAWPEQGRYHPCPASVGFGNGRSVCLGVDEPRRHVRHVASMGIMSQVATVITISDPAGIAPRSGSTQLKRSPAARSALACNTEPAGRILGQSFGAAPFFISSVRES
jgi:hypothetical protein